MSYSDELQVHFLLKKFTTSQLCIWLPQPSFLGLKNWISFQILLFFCWFFSVLGFELRTSHLLGQHCTTWVMPSPLLMLFWELLFLLMCTLIPSHPDFNPLGNSQWPWKRTEKVVLCFPQMCKIFRKELGLKFRI
jgi:hypothetical protein